MFQWNDRWSALIVGSLRQHAWLLPSTGLINGNRSIHCSTNGWNCTVLDITSKLKQVKWLEISRFHKLFDSVFSVIIIDDHNLVFFSRNNYLKRIFVFQFQLKTYGPLSLKYLHLYKWKFRWIMVWIYWNP